MLTIVMLAIIFQRNSRPFNTLAVALFAVLALDPLAVLSAGFWLSFLAVSVIVYAIAGRLGKTGYFLEIIKINWALRWDYRRCYCFFSRFLCSPLANLCCAGHQSAGSALIIAGVLYVFRLLASKLFLYLLPCGFMVAISRLAEL
jgi:competence protein ComEC